MPYNLVREPWLPLRRRGGTVEWVEPWRITDQGPADDNPFLAVDSSRPDFNGALTEFLIGLVQTAWPPPDERAWEAFWKQPPQPEALRAAFEKVAHAFDLDGLGPRFMQQALPAKAELWPAHLLLVEQPEPTKEKDNKDHFIKRGQVGALCRACLAAGLHTLQTYAPSGGRGHFTSVRGGGPLTTLTLGRSLWETVWLAVQPARRFWAKQPRQDDPARTFPWLGHSPQGDKETRLTPEQADSTQVFWGMPRRVWLDFPAQPRLGTCTLCGREGEPLAEGFFVRPNGIKYEGPWLHPLSPHYWKDGAPFAVKGPAGGLSYRHWLGLALGEGAEARGKPDPGRTVVRRAAAISLCDERRAGLAGLLEDRERRLWAFGFDMDNKKARAWVDSRMPLVLVEPGHRVAYEQGVRALLDTAGQAASALARCLKEAWFGAGAKVKSNEGDLERLGQLFWARSEGDFYDALDKLKAFLEQERDFWSVEDRKVVAFKVRWLTTLRIKVRKVFDEYSQYSQVGKVNSGRISEARRNLANWVGPKATSLRKVMELSVIKRSKKQSDRGKGE